LFFVLATGYLLMYYSEHVFWARLRPEDTVGDWLITWLAYSFAAYAFLAVATLFSVHNVWGLFLAGAVFGWLIEGVIVQTMYQNFPLQVSFTGLAWHALISVWVGWYTIPNILREGKPRKIVLVTLVFGSCYGAWAISWWVEAPAQIASVPAFAAFAFGTTLLLILAMWVEDRAWRADFTPRRWEIIAISTLFLLYFAFVTVPAAPSALAILPPLLLAIFLALRRHRQQIQAPGLLAARPGLIQAPYFVYLLLIPLTATLVYTLATLLNLRLPTNWLLYLITMPLGAMLFVLSLWKVWKSSSKPLAS
jgi:hypothetical protein